MEPFTWLLFLCVAMFLGAYAAGSIPLSFSMSESRLRLVTIFGAGLLVGTALIVIIPEGVAMHYDAQRRHSASDHGMGSTAHSSSSGAVVGLAAAGQGGGATPRHLLLVTSSTTASPPSSATLDGAVPEIPAVASAAPAAPAPAAAGRILFEGDAEEGGAHDHDHDHDPSSAAGGADAADFSHEHSGDHWKIGAALAFGFAFQLIVGA
jgi:zinc transporter 9